MLSQPHRSWEAGTEKAFTGQPSREENKKDAAGVRTSAPELSWISDAVPSRLGARKHRPISPPSPSGKQKPAEAHWTASFGTATDWVVPGGLDSPGKAGAGKSSAAPPASDFLDALDIDLCCSTSRRSEPEPEPEPEPQPQPQPQPDASTSTPPRRRSPSSDEKPARQRRPAALLPPPSPSAESLVAAINAAHAPVLPAAFATTPDRNRELPDTGSGTGCHSPNQTSPPEPVRNPWVELDKAQEQQQHHQHQHQHQQQREQREQQRREQQEAARARTEPWALHELIHTPASADTLPPSEETSPGRGYTTLGQRLVRAIFARFDQDRDGHLSKAELRSFAMATEGEVYDDETLEDLLKSFRSGPRGLTLAGFMGLYRETELMDLARDVRQLRIT